MNTPLVAAPVAKPLITFVPVKAELDKAVRKLTEDRVTQEVRRAVNAWLYSR